MREYYDDDLRDDIRDRDYAVASSYPAGDALRAYQMLHVAFVLVPLIAGLDKFAHYLTNWHQYLSPQFAQFGKLLPLKAVGLGNIDLMMIVGGVEIIAALLVAFRPRIGGWVVAAWLWAIIVNLILLGNFYDVALRDFGLSLGAVALALLSPETYFTRRRVHVV